MSTEKFCLKWNDFESNISIAFRDLRADSQLFDVTLACCDNSGEGQKYIQAHKVILSACSPFFRNLLCRQPPFGSGGNVIGNPVIYLRGVKHADMESVLSFMYHGEVNVAQDQLNSFLAVAEDLKVKGLTQNKTNEDSKPPDNRSSSGGGDKRSRSPSRSSIDTSSSGGIKKPRPSQVPSNAAVGGNTPVSRPMSSAMSNADDDDDIQEVIPVKSEPKEITAVSTPHGGGVVPGGAGAVGVGGHVPGPGPQQQQYDDSQQDEYMDETYDESYGQYSEQDYLGDGTAAGGQQIGTDADKGNPDKIMKKYAAYNTQTNQYECTVCHKTCSQRANLMKHIENVHFPNCFVYTCKYCEEQFV